MKLTEQIAAHLRDVHFGGNWTGVNLRDHLSGLSWQQATVKVKSFHTIAELVYHMNYYVSATLRVFEGDSLDAKDRFSFDLPPIGGREDWENLLIKSWADAENLAKAIEQMPETRLWEPFVDEAYGSYYRCLHGPIEHCHYHLGQISLILSMMPSGLDEANLGRENRTD